MNKKEKLLILINIILFICLIISIFSAIHWYKVAKKNQEFHMYQFEQTNKAYEQINNLENKLNNK